MNWILTAVAWAALAGAQGDETRRLSLIAVGDMNLGRHVGQMLLKDSLEYPFFYASDVFSRYDVVLGNLESQITDQNGETQHPRDRYIFCAPPQAAKALRMARFSLVATANNHAYDYKAKGLRETISYLKEAGIGWSGTSIDSVGSFPPALFERNGIRVAFFAFTQFVNRKTGWSGHIALFEKKLAQKDIAALRSNVDLVLVSYHGGDEYQEKPNKRTVSDMRALIDAGADVVFGHHSHVPQGIESYKGKWIFYSLGNFVFYQPQREWTQKGMAVALTAMRDTAGVSIEKIDIFPLNAGFQPSFTVSSADRQLLEERLRRLSRVSIIRKDTTFAVIP